MKQATAKRWDAPAALDTPYRRAQQEWDDRDGHARRQAYSWRLAAFGSFGVAAVAVAGAVYLGTLPKTVVEYVEVDGQGRTAYVGRAGQVGADYQLSHEQIAYHLRDFIGNTRALSSDPLVIRRNWFDAYKYVAGEANQKLTAYAQANDPFQRAEEERVVVEIESVLPIAPATYQADWSEELWSKQGSLKGKEKWRGTFTVTRIVPEDVEVLKANPLGVYITAFSWSRL